MLSPERIDSLGRPRDISLEGHRIDSLVDFSNLWILILFGIMAAWLLAAAFLHREKKHEARYDPGTHKKAWLMAGGIAAFVFFVVDGTLFTRSSRDIGNVLWNFKHADAQPNVVRIEMYARAWVWTARYSGPDGEFGTADDVVTMNDVRVPVNRPVLIQVASADVIHNLYIPQLRIKQDAVPGQITQAWFIAKETGEFEIACAQHCGIAHYKMKARLSVLPEDEFEEWVKLASSDSEKTYVADDTESHWGWAWKRME